MKEIRELETNNNQLVSIRNPVYKLDVVDQLHDATMPKVDEYMANKIAAGKNNGCTLEKAAVRREWYVSSVPTTRY